MTTHLVLGLGEVGATLLDILREAYGDDARGWDIREEWWTIPGDSNILHITFPFDDTFLSRVKGMRGYQHTGVLTIIHSTVPIGTTARIPNAVHSPLLGKRPHLAHDMPTFVKWIGGPRAAEAEDILGPAGFRTRCVPTSEETEALKLLCLAKYGMSIAFSHYETEVCEKVGIPFGDILEWDADYNNHVDARLRRPIMAPLQDTIGGHCVIPGTHILNDQFPHTILQGILKYG